jgi:hypothetical protein
VVVAVVRAHPHAELHSHGHFPLRRHRGTLARAKG